MEALKIFLKNYLLFLLSGSKEEEREGTNSFLLHVISVFSLSLI